MVWPDAAAEVVPEIKAGAVLLGTAFLAVHVAFNLKRKVLKRAALQLERVLH